MAIGPEKRTKDEEREARKERSRKAEEEAKRQTESEEGKGTGTAEAEKPVQESAEKPLGIQPIQPKAKARGRRTDSPEEIPEKAPKATASDRHAFRMFLNMIEAIAVSRLGEEARFTAAEREMIEPQLAEMVSNLSPKTARNLSKWSGSITLATGIFMYSMRCASLPQKGPGVARPISPNNAPVAGVTQRPPVMQRAPVQNTAGRDVTATSPERSNVPKDGSGFIDGGIHEGWEVR